METGKLSTYTIIAFVIGVVLGYLVAWGIYANPTENELDGEERAGLVDGPGTPTDLADDNGTGVVSDEVGGTVDGATNSLPIAPISAGEGEAIAVVDQPAGSVVEVTGVTAADVTWVAVREYHDGALGNILGARRIPGGDGQPVAVELLRPTTNGQQYAVVLYRDNGDLAFNHRTDSLIVADELPVMATFNAN